MSKIVVEFTDEEFEKETKKVFGPKSSSWCQTPAFNHVFLTAQKAYCNDLLQVREHLFLNEVFDMLGLPRTKLGAVLGWTKECAVDFGVDVSIMGIEIPLRFNPNRVVVHYI